MEEYAKSHPKLRSLDAKIEGLLVDRNLKRNKLLPKVDLQYNFLSQDYEQLNSFNLANYKAFVNVSFPIFLRKERGDLQLANYKIQNAEFDKAAASLNIANKIAAINFEIRSLDTQNKLINDIVTDYRLLVNAEERKFILGESSLFLINTREQKLIDAQIKENSLLIKQLNATSRLFNALGSSGISIN
jgi:outer membrane protein TolC